MKKCRVLCLLTIGLALAACNNSASNHKKGDKPADSVLTEINEDEDKESLDYEEVVEIIFEAARSGNYHRLSGLCGKETEGEAFTICGMAEAPAKLQQQFRTLFSKSTILNVGGPHPGQSTIGIKISYGPDGKKECWVECQKKNDGSWYLIGFDDVFDERNYER